MSDTGTNLNNVNNETATKKDLADYFEKLNLLTTGVIVVIGLGFVTLLIAVLSPMIDAWRFRAASYEDLKDQVVIQNTRIESLTNEIQNNKVRRVVVPIPSVSE